MPQDLYTDITLVGGSSVLAAILSQVLAWLRDGRRDKSVEKREADFSALYLSLALENYAAACAEQIGQTETFQASSGSAGYFHTNLSPLPDYPDNINWKAWGVIGTTEAFSFRLTVDAARNYVSHEYEFVDEYSAAVVAQEKASELGVRAIELAAKFRRERKLQPMFVDPSWSLREYLVEKNAQHRRERAKREQRNRESNAKFFDQVDAINTAGGESTSDAG